MSEIANTFKRDFGGIVISALIFVVSFLWKDLLSDIEQIYFPTSQGLLGRFIYIGVVTFSILTFVIFLRKMLHLDRMNQSNPHHFDDAPDRSVTDSPLDIGNGNGGDIGDIGNGNGNN